MHGYQSAWLPAALLQPGRRRACGCPVRGLRHWGFALHFNKGLGGAPDGDRRRPRHRDPPAVLDAFALAICGAEGPPPFPACQAHEPDWRGREARRAIDRAMDALRAGARGRLIRLGERLLRADWQHRILGRQLRQAARGEAQVRPGRPVFRPSRRGQRGVERGRLYASAWRVTKRERAKFSPMHTAGPGRNRWCPRDRRKVFETRRAVVDAVCDCARPSGPGGPDRPQKNPGGAREAWRPRQPSIPAQAPAEPACGVTGSPRLEHPWRELVVVTACSGPSAIAMPAFATCKIPAI